ncbi:MAG: response regulator transcription factor [Phycisphaerae bacterium]|nr:response regulator transcription factor [Phycisphaerae bacterium]
MIRGIHRSADRLEAASGHPSGHPADGQSRLNLLLAYGGWRDDTFADQLPALLAPQGIRCFRSRSAREAQDVILHQRVHIAVVDLSTPADESSAADESFGARILHLLRPLRPAPPVVVVHAPQVSNRDSSRMLAAALREGAFSVLQRPVPMESMLATLRRVVERHYRGAWPQGGF